MEEEAREDEEFERRIREAHIRPVWKGDIGVVPNPPKKVTPMVKQFRPRL